MMQWSELKEWRRQFAKVDGKTAVAMKQVAYNEG